MDAELQLQQQASALQLSALSSSSSSSSVVPAPAPVATGGDVAFFLNQAAAFLARAEQGGLQSAASLRRFLFASWLALAAAEGMRV